jgi:hypothetical protein
MRAIIESSDSSSNQTIAGITEIWAWLRFELLSRVDVLDAVALIFEPGGVCTEDRQPAVVLTLVSGRRLWKELESSYV